MIRAARHQFSVNGFAGTSFTSVAAEAGVDVKLVRYYFSTKEALFDAAVTVPDEFRGRVRSALEAPIEERGRALVRCFTEAWKDAPLAESLRAALLIAGHEERALELLRANFESTLIHAVEESVPTDERLLRATLITSQILGFSFARNIYRFAPAVDLDEEVVIDTVGATVQRYLTGPLT
ncbi:TetR family transcriptional regulator [Leifsonia sp. NPDC058194]|uniref:TetR/AcrR family transcriptional regulator n=1 Tax=Leifsonia sp. NPDC058194 TaxID=3346374 RepID=UPI0036DAC670